MGSGNKCRFPCLSALEGIWLSALANLWVLHHAVFSFYSPTPSTIAPSLHSLHTNHLSGTVFPAKTLAGSLFTKKKDNSTLRQRVVVYHWNLTYSQCLNVENNMTLIQDHDWQFIVFFRHFQQDVHVIYINIIGGLGKSP